MKSSSVRGFTLVELLISIVIIAILVGVIFSIYRTIINITVRVENEKIVANEMLFAHQTIQNLVDNYTIDYNHYLNQGNQIASTQGFTTGLYLTQKPGNTNYLGSFEIKVQNDALILIKDGGSPIPLTDNSKVVVTGLQFQLIPYNLTGSTAPGAIPIGSLYFASVNDIKHPGFWIRGTMQLKRYQSDSYVRSVQQPLQSFFNIRSY